jgi:hypothetical protein
MDKKDPTKKMINVCAWCGKLKHGIFDDSASVTHGICQECLNKAIRQDEDKRKG